MSTIQVKPAPTLSAAAAKVIVHPASGGLLDPAGQIPADGRPWLYDGFTCRMLVDGVILRADDPAFTVRAAGAAVPPAPNASDADAPQSGAETTPAH